VRRVITTILVVATSVVVGLILCEGLARIYEHVSCVPVVGAFNRFDRHYGWANRPSTRGRNCGCLPWGKEYWADVTVNANGLRGAETTVARSDAARILVLGDSFTAGMQVEDAEVFPYRLEQRLNARGGRRVEVVNTGVNGWATDNQIQYWRYDGWRYAPDLVLLAFDTTNDVFENQRRLVSLYSWPDKPHARLRAGVLTIEGDPLPPLRTTRRLETDAGSLLTLDSGLFRLLTSRVTMPPRMFFLPLPLPPPDAVLSVPGDIYRVQYPEVWTEAWRITRGLVLRLRSEVQRRGSRFAVAVVNPREEVSMAAWKRLVSGTKQLAGVPVDRDKPNRLITRFLARRGIPTIELLPAFRERFPDGTPGFFPFNIHWAPPGHELAAEVIAEGVERQALLPR